MTNIHTPNDPTLIAQLQELSKPKFIYIEDIIYYVGLIYEGPDWRAEGVEFLNCTFKGQVQFERLSLQCGARFENCVFERQVYFEHVNAGHVSLDFNVNGEVSLEFINCTFNAGLNLSDCKLWCGFRARQNTKFDNVHFLKSGLRSVELTEVKVAGLFQVTKCKFDKWFLADECGFEKQFTFIECETRIEVERSQFEVAFFSGNKFTKVDISTSSFSGEAYFFACGIESLFLAALNFDKKLQIEGRYPEVKQSGYIKSFQIADVNFKVGLLLTGSGDSPDIGELRIRSAESMGGNLDFTNCQIGKAFLFGINTSILSFSFAKLQEIHLDQWVNKGLFNLISVGAANNNNSLIVIRKSFLGKAVWSDVDLKSYKDILISHSTVYEITTSAVTWFNDQQLCREDGCSDLAAAKISKDLYRQLKFAMERQGDHFTKLYFKQLEHEAYRQELRLTAFRDRSFGDQILMSFGWINAYGFNWLRPMIIILLWVLVCFVILAYYSRPQNLDLKYLVNSIDSLFALFNPIHRLNEIFVNGVFVSRSGWFYFWDFFERLFLSVLLFQLVTAFRKYAN